MDLRSKRLPLGIQDFEELRNGNYHYVDKTDCELEEERHVANGRIDLVAHHRDCMLVMEMKMDANGGEAAAEGQITDRHYAAAYLAEQKPVYTVAMEFSTKQREMIGFLVNQVK